MTERAHNVEEMVENVLAMVDRQPHSVFDGEIVDRRWLRETLDRSATAPLHRLCELVMRVLIEEYDMRESEAQALAAMTEEILPVLWRRLSS